MGHACSQIPQPVQSPLRLMRLSSVSMPMACSPMGHMSTQMEQSSLSERRHACSSKCTYPIAMSCLSVIGLIEPVGHNVCAC